MKYTLLNIIIISLSVFTIANAQVGVETNEPKASIDIKAKKGNIADGILVPRLTAEEVKSMTNASKVATPQNSLLIYITKTFTTAPATGKYELITSKGFYYYDAHDSGGKWKKLLTNSDNIDYTAGAGITIDKGVVSATGLEKVGTNENDGWRLIRSDNYQNIGNNAIDLSFRSNGSGAGNGAGGDYSIAAGQSTTASGSYSVAMGLSSIASGENSFVIGRSNRAIGNNSVAMGDDSTATGTTSFAMGRQAKTNGNDSASIGYNTKSNGEHSIAMGSSAIAGGKGSISMGISTNASGEASVALGNETKASAMGSVAIGKYNEDNSNYLFMVGNGNSNTDRKNAFWVDNLGNAHTENKLYTKAVHLSSDIRLKKEIKPILEGSLILSSLHPVEYYWKDNDKNKELQFGFIAQELEGILPNLVNTESEGEKYKSVNYIGLIPILTKALQEKSEEIEHLKIQLQQQEQQIQDQEARLKALEEKLK